MLHNINQFTSIPLAHSTCRKESYENIKLLLSKIQYSTHVWKICVHFKVLNMLLGQPSGFTKYPCFYVFQNTFVLYVNGTAWTGLISELNMTGR